MQCKACPLHAQDCITDDVDRRPSMKEIVRRLRAARTDAPASADPNDVTGAVSSQWHIFVNTPRHQR